MQRFRLVLVALLTFGLVIGGAFLKKTLSVTLCSLLFFHSTACYTWSDSGRVSAAVPAIEEAVPPETPQEIAIPPIIRQAPIDLQDSLAEDFVISRQTPYSSGRNEILVTSPSTGTEQRYQINLPGTGDFRLYEAAFSNVSINNPSQVVEGGASQLSAAQIQGKLKSFKITFNSDNLPAEVVLADGTKAEFTNTEAVIRSPNGQVVETVPISSAELPTDGNVAAKSYAKVGEADSLLLAESNASGCQGNIRNKLARLADDMANKGDKIKAAANSSEAMLMTWVLTFGSRAMKESISDRNVKLEEVACQPPVQCNQPQMYEGGSEIRTDLFQLPVGTNREVSLEYEFYQIPDRLELSYEGKIIFDVGPASGRSTKTISNLPDGAGYVGIRLIGNDDSNTKWWYTISCSGKAPVVEVVLFTGFSTNLLASGDPIGIGTLRNEIVTTFTNNSSTLLSLNATIYDWDQEPDARRAILNAQQSESIDYLIIIGHSLGGDSSIDLARELGNQQPVNLLVQIDSVGYSDDTVPGNVNQAVNYFQSHQANVAGFREVNRNVQGSENINATERLNLDAECPRIGEAIHCSSNRCEHGCIDDHPSIHRDIIRRISKILLTESSSVSE